MVSDPDDYTENELLAFSYGYKRGMEEAAKIIEYHAGICTDRHDRHWLGDIANLIRAKIQERDE